MSQLIDRKLSLYLCLCSSIPVLSFIHIAGFVSPWRMVRGETLIATPHRALCVAMGHGAWREPRHSLPFKIQLSGLGTPLAKTIIITSIEMKQDYLK